MEKTDLDLATFGIAAGGLALGLANSFSNFLRSRHRANVVFWNYVDSLGRKGLAVTVENAGHTTFAITSIGIQLKGGKAIFSPVEHRDVLPKVLHPGEYCEVVFPDSCYLGPLGRDVKRVFASLPTGKKFYSKRLTCEFLGVRS